MLVTVVDLELSLSRPLAGLNHLSTLGSSSRMTAKRRSGSESNFCTWYRHLAGRTSRMRRRRSAHRWAITSAAYGLAEAYFVGKDHTFRQGRAECS